MIFSFSLFSFQEESPVLIAALMPKQTKNKIQGKGSETGNQPKKLTQIEMVKTTAENIPNVRTAMVALLIIKSVKNKYFHKLISTETNKN